MTSPLQIAAGKSRNPLKKANVFATVLALALAFFLSLEPDLTLAAGGKECFGKRVNRVVTADGKRVKLAYRDVVWVSGRGTTVVGKPYSVICAGDGSQTIHAGKGRSLTDAGPGNDRIVLHPSSNRNDAKGGVGNDVIIGSRGHDFLQGGPKVVRSGVTDRDVIHGEGGNDRIRDYGGIGNRLYGQAGSDRIFSLGSAVSELHGGNGTDFLYSNGGGSKSTRLEKLFGERGNDRLFGDRTPNNGPAFLDPGTGDDWIYGTKRDDTIIFSSGIKKVYANGGNDLVLGTSFGRSTVDGGSGTDTISFATHTPPGYRGATGVYVDLNEGFSIGASRYDLSNFEDVIGSSFDDELTGSMGTDNSIKGGLGDDILTGYRNDRDSGDGGIGINECRGFQIEIDCNQESPGNYGKSNPVVEVEEDGVLTIIGSSLDDEVRIDYQDTSQRYLVRASPNPIVGGLCEEAVTGGPVVCPASIENLNGVLVYGDDGDDEVTIGDSVPSSVTTTINGGSGLNTLTGGRTKDNITSEAEASAGTVIDGRAGSDLLHLRDDVRVYGGPGPDVLRVVDPCVGGLASGGPDQDGLVFAGAPRGVRADFGRATAEWAQGGCPAMATRLSMKHDIENLEGTAYNDRLILGRKRATQDGKGSLLGREGVDYLDSRNGKRDTVTTGSNGRRNTVVADRIDKVIWGWGLSGY